MGFSLRRSRSAARAGIVAAGLVGLVSPAAAIDFDRSFRLVDEVQFGAAVHDPSTREEGTVDVLGQVLSSPIVTARSGSAVVDALMAPRLHLGASLNTGRRTDLVWAGFTWRWKFDDRFFVDGSLGGAWNDSPKHSTTRQVAMGCAVTFREALDLGWRLTDRVDLLVGVAHASHAGLCSDTNPGLTQIQAKLGYRF
jgi:hypothetical protein